MSGSLRARLPALVADGVAALLGSWAVYSLVCVYAGLSFHTLVRGSFLPVLVGLGLAVANGVWPEPEAVPPPEAQGRVGLGPLLLLGAGGLGLVAWSQGASFWPAWVALTGSLIWAAYATRNEHVHHASPLADGKDLLAIAAVGAGFVLFVLGMYRPSQDDAYHLSVIAGTLDHRDLAVLSFDTLHGDVSVPIQQLIHRPQTTELISALVMAWTGWDLLMVYYFVVPGMFALAVPFGAWVLAKSISVRAAWLALLVLAGLWWVWGGSSTTFGNFAFVRFYHGKSVFLCVIAPIIVYRAMRLSSRPALRSWGLLTLSMLGAVSLTSSALVLAPTLAALTVLASVRRDKAAARTLLLGFTTALPVLAVLFLVRWELSLAGPLVSTGKMKGMVAVFGKGLHAPIALFALAALPFVARAAGQRSAWLIRYTLIAFVLVLNEQVAWFMGEHVAKLFSWRWFWVLPVPVLVASSVAISVHDIVSRRRLVPGVAHAVVAGAVVFALVGPWVNAPEYVKWAWLEPRLSMWKRDIAVEVLDHVGPDSVVLAPPDISAQIASQPHHPRLIAVREIYTNNLSRHWGPRESRARWNLIRFGNGAFPLHRAPAFLDQLDARCIDVYVSTLRFSRIDGIADLMHERGFEATRVRRFDLWTRDVPPDVCPPTPHP